MNTGCVVRVRLALGINFLPTPKMRTLKTPKRGSGGFEGALLECILFFLWGTMSMPARLKTQNMIHIQFISMF